MGFLEDTSGKKFKFAMSVISQAVLENNPSIPQNRWGQSSGPNTRICVFLTTSPPVEGGELVIWSEDEKTQEALALNACDAVGFLGRQKHGTRDIKNGTLIQAQ